MKFTVLILLSFTLFISCAEELVESACENKLPTLINCFDDVVVTCEENQIEKYVQIAQFPDFTNSNDLIITNNFNDGGQDASGIFPIGVTKITYTIKDDCNNVTTCSHEITVLPYFCNNTFSDSIDSLITKFSAPDTEFDIDGDNINDIKISWRVFTGEIGVAEIYISFLDEIWAIATAIKSDTIVIDTNYITDVLYNTSHIYYDPIEDSSWDTIKTYNIPYVSPNSQINCSSQQFHSDILYIYRDPFFTIGPFTPYFEFDYINPGIEKFDGFLTFKNLQNNKCYIIYSSFEPISLEFGEPHQLCE